MLSAVYQDPTQFKPDKMNVNSAKNHYDNFDSRAKTQAS
jgi:hypothetical protein